MLNKVFFLYLLLSFSSFSTVYCQNGEFKPVNSPIISDDHIDDILKSIKLQKNDDLKIIVLERQQNKWIECKAIINKDSFIYVAKRTVRMRNKNLPIPSLYSFSDMYIFEPEHNYVSDKLDIIILSRGEKIITIYSLNHELFNFFITHDTNLFGIDKRFFAQINNMNKKH